MTDGSAGALRAARWRRTSSWGRGVRCWCWRTTTRTPCPGSTPPRARGRPSSPWAGPPSCCRVGAWGGRRRRCWRRSGRARRWWRRRRAAGPTARSSTSSPWAAPAASTARRWCWTRRSGWARCRWNLAAIRPDAVVVSVHKWLLGLYSFAFLYVAPEGAVGRVMGSRWARGGVPLEHHDRNRVGSEAWDDGGFFRASGGEGGGEEGWFPRVFVEGAARYDMGGCAPTATSAAAGFAPIANTSTETS